MALGETDVAVRFLVRLHPGPWLVCAIAEGRPPEIAALSDQRAAAEWIELRQGKSNLYVHVNRHKAYPKRGKASKDDIAAVGYLHCDIDPVAGDGRDADRARIREMLEKFTPAPTMVVDSGNGFNVYWKLKTEVGPEQFPAVEARNRWLAQMLGGDHTYDVSRILRLPGTINIPNDIKRKRGRTPQLSRLLTDDGTRVYTLDAFKEVAADPPSPRGVGRFVAVPDDAGAEPDLEAILHRDEDSTLRGIIMKGDNPDTPYDDRSKLVYWVACECRRRGISEDDTARLLLWRRKVGESKIADHVYAQGNPRGYAARQIERARDEVTREDEKKARAVEGFQTDDKGRPLPNEFNVRVALDKLELSLKFDEFNDSVLINDRPMQDHHVKRLFFDLPRNFGFKYPKDLLFDLVEVVAREARFHPVRDYLNSLDWDQQPRIDGWLTAYCGVEHNPYTRAVGGLVLMAACKRIAEPGCKFDEILVLESGEGVGKSTALEVLGGEWFSNSFPLGGDGKEVLEQTRGKWIIEVAELVTRRDGVDRIKAQLSTREDSGRPAYGRYRVDKKREFIMFGTTNRDDYLQGDTGNRRWWPVKVAKIDIEALKADRDQLWAEAWERVRANESIRLAEELWPMAAKEQAARLAHDPWEDDLIAALGDRQGKIAANTLWQILDIDPRHKTPKDAQRLSSIMKKLGWHRPNSGGTARLNGVLLQTYVRGDGPWLFWTEQGGTQAETPRSAELKTPFS